MALYYVSASGAIGASGKPQFVRGAVITAAAANAAVTLYDGTGTGGTKLLVLKAVIASSGPHTFGCPQEFPNGCYAELAGAGAEATVEVE